MFVPTPIQRGTEAWARVGLEQDATERIHRSLVIDIAVRIIIVGTVHGHSG